MERDEWWVEGRTDERERCKKRRLMYKRGCKEAEGLVSVCLRAWQRSSYRYCDCGFWGVDVCVCARACVCDSWGGVQGIFLGFDGQLNAWLVKTAEQNVPRAKGRGEVTHRYTCSHTYTIQAKCGVVVLLLFIGDPVVWVDSHWVVGHVVRSGWCFLNISPRLHRTSSICN